MVAAGNKLRVTDLNSLNKETKASYTTQGGLASSTGAEAAMASWSPASNGIDTPFTFLSGYLYRVDVTGGVTNSDAMGTIGLSTVRVRKGVNTTSGQQLLYSVLGSFGGGSVVTFSIWGFVKNATGADITSSLGVTIVRSAGAGTNTVWGDANYRFVLAVTRIGLIANQDAGSVGAAVAIT